MSTIQKVGVVLLLLVLICGPLLQIYDCFNDPPNVDHDALLHTVDAFLCLIFILILTGFCGLVLAMLRLIRALPDDAQIWIAPKATIVHFHPLHSAPSPIRI